MLGQSFKQMLKNTGIFGVGVFVHHYGSKYLGELDEIRDRKRLASQNKLSTEEKLDKILEMATKTDSSVSNLEESFNNMSEIQVKSVEQSNRVSSDLNELKNWVSDFKKLGETIDSETTLSQESLNKLYGAVDTVSKGIDKLEKTITEILSSNSKNNFMPDIGISKIYEYLDSLTLLEESSLLHIFMFSIILLILTGIIGTLLSNEIVKYFNIEDKYPSISTFLKIRSKYQRYYLLWNVFSLFIICFMGIGVNLMVFVIR